MKNKTILENMKAGGMFNTLLNLINIADMKDDLDSKAAITVFAPTDKAFDEIPKSQLEKLKKNKERLTKILQYHFSTGKVTADDIKKMDKIKTLHGRHIDIKVTDKGVLLNGAKIIKSDIECLNGIIHIIDSVMMP
ncbi:MAG: fasciclin domain-containing protein [bacterium]